MTIQTDPEGRAPGDNYTVLRGRRDVLRHLGRRRDFSVAAVDALRRLQPRRTASTRTSGSSARSASTAFSPGRIRPASPAARWRAKARSSGTTTACTRSIRCSASATTSATTSASSSGPASASTFADFGIRPQAGGAAQVRHPRAAPAHALQHLHRPVEREGVAHQPCRDGRFFENGANVEFAANPRFERIIAAVQGAARPVVRARQLRLERIRPADRDEPQPGVSASSR